MTNGTPKLAPPATAAEAERRFFDRYGGSAGSTWAAVQGFIGSNASKPTTIEGWIAVAESVRDQIRIIETAADEESPLFPLKPNNDMARLVTAFERIATALEKLSERPAPAVPASAKPKLEATFGPDGIPICPKHNRRMRESDFGGWFCTAKDDEGKNGRCGFKVKE